MQRDIASLAEAIGASVLGDLGFTPRALRPIDEADEDSLCPLFRSGLLAPSSRLPGAVLAPPSLSQTALERGVRAVLSHDDPAVALAALIDIFFPVDEGSTRGFVHPLAVVDETASIHPLAWVGPGAVIEGGVVIEEGAWIGPNAVICSKTTVGRFARIGPCAVIGHEGFGFAPTANGPVKIRQVGGVRIGDFAEIGAAACVDRATLGTTVIGAGTKIDNLVQVGHNAVVGDGVLVAAQVGLAGSTRIGDGAMIGGQVGVADHRRVGAGARITAQSGVTRDIAPGSIASGTPALPRQRWLEGLARLLRSRERNGKPETEDS